MATTFFNSDLNSKIDSWGVSGKNRNTIFDVTANYLSEKPHSSAKAVVVALDCLDKAGIIDGENPAVKKTSDGLSLFKLTRAPFNLAKDFNSLCHKTWNWWQGEKLSEKKQGEKVDFFHDVFRQALSLPGHVWEIASFFTKAILHIPKQSVQTLKGVSAGFLIASMGWSTIDSLTVLYENFKKQGKPELKTSSERFYENVGHLFKLTSQICLIVLGILTVLTVFFEYVFSPLLLTVISTVTVVVGIFDYYHENLGLEKTP